MHYEVIIQKVMEILVMRSRSKLVVSLMNPVPPEKVLIRYGQILIKDISLSFLQSYLDGESTTTWEKWIRKAEEFGSEVALQVACDGILQQINLNLLSGYKAKLYSKEGRQITTVNPQILSYAEVAMLPPGCLLLIRKNQLATPLAKEELTKRNIKMMERL